MSNIDKEIWTLLNKIRNRLYVAFMIKCLLIGISIAAAAATMLCLIARFVPIYKAYSKGIIIALVGVGAALLFGVVKKPKCEEAAITVDSLGLKERTITAVELKGKESAFADLQKRDALQQLKDLNYKDKLPVRPKNKYLAISLLLISCFTLTAFMPNSMDEKATQQHKLKEAKRSELKKVEKLEKEINKNEKLTEVQKKELENKLAELKKYIENSADEKELDKTIKKEAKKLELAKDDKASESIKKLQEGLSKENETKALAEAVKKGDKEQFQKEMKKLNEKLKNMSEEEKTKLSKQLSNISKEMKDSEGSKEALSKLSEDIAKGDLSKSSEDMEKLSDNVKELMEEDSMKSVLDQMKNTLADEENNSENGSDGKQSAQGGNSGQQGQQGSQEGQGGGGAGEGSGNGEKKSGEAAASSGGLKKNDSQGKEQEYEKVFTPKNLGGIGEKSELTGKKNNNGSTDIENSKENDALRGESVPYDQVMGEYKDRAMESMNNSDIPEGMMEIIKSYFTSLEN